MSNLKTVQSQIKTFLTSRLHIDGWDLDAPEDYLSSNVEGKQACTAIAYPPQNLEHKLTGVNALLGTATLNFSITYRFPTELTESELPLQDFTSIVEYLMAGALMEISGCGAIQTLEANNIEFPIFVQRMDELNKDWLVILNLSYRVSYPIKEFGVPPVYGPGGGNTYEPYEVQQFTLGVYRGRVGDLEDNVLDTELTFVRD